MPGTDDELEAILGILARDRADEDAWVRLYRRMRPYVVAAILRRTRNRSAIEDLTQEVFLRLARFCSFEEIASAAAFRQYLALTCRSVVLNHARAERGSPDAVSPMEVVGEALESAGSVEAAVSARDLWRAVREKVGGADAKLLELLLGGFSVAQIAAETGLTAGNVAVRLHRVRKRLRPFAQKWTEDS